MDFQKPLGDWLIAHAEPVRGVFFTHLHLDHISGAPDLPKATPIYAGPGETRAPLLPRVLAAERRPRARRPPSRERVAVRAGPRRSLRRRGRRLRRRLVLGPLDAGPHGGQHAYLARTTRGPVLFTGDTSHTRWGWENDVEPGSFTTDHAENVDSLERLRRLVREHPAIDVRLGHSAPRSGDAAVPPRGEARPPGLTTPRGVSPHVS
jgi:glyoxylase-like metal-dependent hydrolase (beta-lactamase superfamily II)